VLDLELENTQVMNYCLTSLTYLDVFVTDAIVDDQVKEREQSRIFLL
jgi:hypothetical protein